MSLIKLSRLHYMARVCKYLWEPHRYHSFLGTAIHTGDWKKIRSCAFLWRWPMCLSSSQRLPPETQVFGDSASDCFRSSQKFRWLCDIFHFHNVGKAFTFLKSLWANVRPLKQSSTTGHILPEVNMFVNCSTFIHDCLFHLLFFSYSCWFRTSYNIFPSFNLFSWIFNFRIFLKNAVSEYFFILFPEYFSREY